MASHEGMQQKNVRIGPECTLSSRELPEWFPELTGTELEVMRALCIGRHIGNSAGSQTLIFLVRRFTDRHCILKAARKNAPTLAGQTTVMADYSNFTNATTPCIWPFQRQGTGLRKADSKHFCCHTQTWRRNDNFPVQRRRILSMLGSIFQSK